MKKDYPILEYDANSDAVISPRQKKISVPEHCVLSFFNDEINKLHQKGIATRIGKLKSEMGSHLLFKISVDENEIALFHPGVGAPLSAALFDEFISFGCKKFIVCGGAGVLGDIAVGELLVPTTAMRDEGTSYHYLPPAREVAAHQDAITAIESTLTAHKINYSLIKTWTTDGFYRETRNKIELRKSEGCSTVEMEAAALFAVANFRNVKIAQILYAGDDLSGKKWDNRSWNKMSELRQKLIWLAAEACLQIK